MKEGIAALILAIAGHIIHLDAHFQISLLLTSLQYEAHTVLIITIENIYEGAHYV
jgi:hypothetical protein